MTIPILLSLHSTLYNQIQWKYNDGVHNTFFFFQILATEWPSGLEFVNRFTSDVCCSLFGSFLVCSIVVLRVMMVLGTTGFGALVRFGLLLVAAGEFALSGWIGLTIPLLPSSGTHRLSWSMCLFHFSPSIVRTINVFLPFVSLTVALAQLFFVPR